MFDRKDFSREQIANYILWFFAVCICVFYASELKECSDKQVVIIDQGADYETLIKFYDSVHPDNTQMAQCLESGLSVKEQIECILTGIEDSAGIMNCILSETGNLKSEQFKRNNNLFGFHNGNNYLFFDHWVDSLRFFMDNFYVYKHPSESFCAFLRRKKFGANGMVNYCMSK